MYIPKHYELNDVSVLSGIIQTNAFAPIITSSPDGPIATHIPILLDGSPDTDGKLQAHMARANKHWRRFETADEPSLIIFEGPHAYVSATDYGVDERIVPAWQHILVHCYGYPSIIEDEKRTRKHLESW